MRAVFDEATRAARRLLTGPDGLFALGVLLSLGAMLEVTAYGPDDSDAGSAMAWSLLATLPLLFARRFLIVSAAVSAFATLVIATDPTVPFTVSAVLAMLVVIHLVARRHRRYVSALFAVPFLLNVMFPFSGDTSDSTGVVLLVLVVAAQLLGDAQRQKGTAIADRDATQRAMTETMREQMAMAERARIARELHDVVAHHLSVIAVQAETARLTTPAVSEEGQDRFQAIGDTARDALTEMRRLLGVLRDDAGGETERGPQPGLDQLAELVNTARAAGTPVRLILQGKVVPLLPGVDLTAYRIVQEALTNTRRHAPGAQVDVELTYGDDVLRLRVSDTGPGPDTDVVEGHGLTGMRERVAMVGGTLHAGPADGGGLAIEADRRGARESAS